VSAFRRTVTVRLKPDTTFQRWRVNLDKGAFIGHKNDTFI
jgi:hypothetical protein